VQQIGVQVFAVQGTTIKWICFLLIKNLWEL